MRSGPASRCGAGERLRKYAMICQRSGSGNALQLGMPFHVLPFLSSQNKSPSVALRTSSPRRLGLPWRPSASAP